MAVLKFDTYQVGTSSAKHVGSIEWDPDVNSPAEIALRTNKVLEALKNKSLIVSPNGPEAAWIIGKPKQGGRKLEIAPAVVRDVHKLYVEDGVDLKTIPFLIYNAHKDPLGEGLVIKDNVVKDILAQKRGVDVTGIDELRETAQAKIGATSSGGKGARRKYTDADKEEWVRLHVEENMSGSAIGKRFGINSSIINTHLREQNVQRNRRGGVKAVKTA